MRPRIWWSVVSCNGKPARRSTSPQHQQAAQLNPRQTRAAVGLENLPEKNSLWGGGWRPQTGLAVELATDGSRPGASGNVSIKARGQFADQVIAAC